MWNLSPSSFILVSRCVHLIRWEGNITPPLSLIPSQEFFLKKGMSLNFMLHWISEHLEYQIIWYIRTFGISEHLKYQNIITLWKDPNVSHTFECFLCLFRIQIWKRFLFSEIFVSNAFVLTPENYKGDMLRKYISQILLFEIILNFV